MLVFSYSLLLVQECRRKNRIFIAHVHVYSLHTDNAMHSYAVHADIEIKKNLVNCQVEQKGYTLVNKGKNASSTTDTQTHSHNMGISADREKGILNEHNSIDTHTHTFMQHCRLLCRLQTHYPFSSVRCFFFSLLLRHFCRVTFSPFTCLSDSDIIRCAASIC